MSYLFLMVSNNARLVVLKVPGPAGSASHGDLLER